MDLEQLLRGTPAFASRFELKESLGEGGMGAVFRARDNYRDRDVAIKASVEMQAALSRAIMTALVARLHHADARYLSQAFKMKEAGGSATRK